MRIAITGGLGFIGTALRQIIHDRHSSAEVLVVDSLHPQIHGQTIRELGLSPGEQFISGSVVDKAVWKRCLDWQPSCIVHLAAETGTGQSMYQPSTHIETNTLGTALMVEALLEAPASLKEALSIVLTSSRAVYGEGAQFCCTCGMSGTGKPRMLADLQNALFDVRCSFCDSSSTRAVPTKETDAFSPVSIYGWSKALQEHLVANIRHQVKSCTIVRPQNVYGEGQSLRNPYTGILTIFSTLMMNHEEIQVFEDGHESRDFVHISDVAKILCNIIEMPSEEGIVNIGTGEAISVLDLIQKIAGALEVEPLFHVTKSGRVGDIRHAIADISRMRKILKKEPVSLDEGLRAFVSFLKNCGTSEIASLAGRYRASLGELKQKSLMSKNKS